MASSEEDRIDSLWNSAISPQELIEELSQIPPGIRLVRNSVGNLAGLDEDRNYVGWLDLSKPARWNLVDPE